MIIFTEVNRNNYYTSNSKKRINLVNKFRNFIFDYYDDYYYEYKKFKDYYIIYHYRYNRLFIINYSNYSGEKHREDGPAWVYYNNDEIKYKQYYLKNKEYSYKDYILKIKK